jgi:hypothetical protein
VSNSIYRGTITDGIKTSNPKSAKHVLTHVIKKWTMLPIPSIKTWKEAVTAQDHDLNLFCTHLKNKTTITKGPLENTAYHKEWINGKLETKDGIMYQLEIPKATRIRQLRHKIVPLSL